MAESGKYGHQADGQTPARRAKEAGYQYRENILADFVTETGVSVASSHGMTFYAVQLFGRPKSAAIKFKRMSQLSRLAYLNFRNHRKLAVADGERAILGEANIVEDELADPPDKSAWVDLSLCIEGPAATQLQAVFCSDWNFETKEELPPSELEEGNVADPNNGSRLTVMPIGPDGADEILGDFWQFVIHQAKRRIWICTPYFVPQHQAMRSLEMACRRGIDVQILVPQVSDLRPVDYARADYFQDLVELGCKVHLCDRHRASVQ